MNNQALHSAINLYRDGSTVKDASKETGIDEATLSRHLKARGIPIRLPKGNWSQDKIDHAIVLYQWGLSLAAVGRSVGSKPSTVSKYMRESGIEIRTERFYSSGQRNPAWKHGRNKAKGYVYLYAPDHPNRTVKNQVSEHRLVMEKMLGRYLLPTEVVDHLNGIRDDNRPENLRLFSSNGEHLRETRKGCTPKWSEDGRRRLKESARQRSLAAQAKRTDPPQTSGAAP